MPVYTTIFFDLDHTLWDYETNSRETLMEIFAEHKLLDFGISGFEAFLQQFKIVNQKLWHLYDHGKITSEIIRNQRFVQILEKFNVSDEPLSQKLSEYYLNVSPKKGNLMPCAVDTLKYLSKNYSLSVITNGFDDVQRTKLQAANITSYFDHIVTSETAGHKKPAREIFHFALEANNISANQAVMIGDNLSTDIAGAKNASIDSIFFNPEKIEHKVEVNHEINQLDELCALL
ncbi:MAG: YjjG family noncanonical pyrimidine nucleotidase [Cyclobacteriaceae bacterium]|nr:YjjG family noncanonical pyrimidine nucleotidase [Cyclobacteriaceae bacterium]